MIRAINQIMACSARLRQKRHMLFRSVSLGDCTQVGRSKMTICPRVSSPRFRIVSRVLRKFIILFFGVVLAMDDRILDNGPFSTSYSSDVVYSVERYYCTDIISTIIVFLCSEFSC
jgi:hypothetical protein